MVGGDYTWGKMAVHGGKPGIGIDWPGRVDGSVDSIHVTANMVM